MSSPPTAPMQKIQVSISSCPSGSAPCANTPFCYAKRDDFSRLPSKPASLNNNVFAIHILLVYVMFDCSQWNTWCIKKQKYFHLYRPAAPSSLQSLQHAFKIERFGWKDDMISVLFLKSDFPPKMSTHFTLCHTLNLRFRKSKRKMCNKVSMYLFFYS